MTNSYSSASLWSSDMDSDLKSDSDNINNSDPYNVTGTYARVSTNLEHNPNQ